MPNNILLTTVIISTLIIILLVAVVAVVIFLAKKQGETQALAMKELALDFEKELRISESDVSESVMKHIARELHDNITMIFTTANLGLNMVMVDHLELVKELNPIRDALSNGIAQLRHVSHAMNQDYISNKTICEMIDMEVERLKSLGKFQIHSFSERNSINISKNQELIVFRIFQEIIQNIIKHSSAKNIFIHVSGSNGFQLTVSDDGIGFDKDRITNLNGIRNIMERAKLAQLSCEYESAPNKGCKVIIQQEVQTK